MTAVQDIVVAIPARDEERLLPGCLRSILKATRHLALHDPGVRVHTMVGLDSCSDRSESIVERFGLTSVTLSGEAVGRARDAAITEALQRMSQDHVYSPSGDDGVDLSRVWVANTDADSQVPSNWLIHQVALARRSVDLVLGTTEPHRVDPTVLALWRARHTLAEGHPYVHGANLGLRATVWHWVGGFGHLAVHEDVELVRRAKLAGARWVATDRIRVKTSARTSSRVNGGFADYLQGLTAASPPTTPVS